MVELVLCSANQHKAQELAELLQHAANVVAMPAGTNLPPETGDTFLANAQIKAQALAGKVGDAWVLADDSGLEVDYLDGAPGVYSARFAGNEASEEDNVRLLLEKLEGVPAEQRSARFVCVLVAISPHGKEIVASGYVNGTITDTPRGIEGFGYDPVFVPDGHKETFAELGEETKSLLSHRAEAVTQLATLLAIS